jgi:hypothetical protein
MGCHHTAVHNLNTLFSLKLKILGGGAYVRVSVVFMNWWLAGKCTLLFLHTHHCLFKCAVQLWCVTRPLFYQQEKAYQYVHAATLHDSAYLRVACSADTHTCSVPRPVMGFTAPHVPDPSVCDCHVFKPSQESTEGPSIHVRESCQRPQQCMCSSSGPWSSSVCY